MTVSEVIKTLNDPQKISIAVNGFSSKLEKSEWDVILPLIGDYTVDSINADGAKAFEIGIKMQPQRI